MSVKTKIKTIIDSIMTLLLPFLIVGEAAQNLNVERDYKKSLSAAKNFA